MYLYLYEDILSTGSVTAAIRTTIKLHEKFIDIFELHYLDEVSLHFQCYLFYVCFQSPL